ncbi:hypothetical protein, variant [Aphanomyces invadans]|uniref:FYVE-type domain-containing protein n=1 Tax=Aphanomyces invadans TaxID=157072 RepID=A0A024TYW9_9STRA|nr:hypothetical protein, variant [Aphanomyces invadans]ETV98537.1 hypothetical protein, variant [Aphanomyces invadans]|eukprot:XP_008872734.1 hypothetical protein, variant [Aphanomyces invadans]
MFVKLRLSLQYCLDVVCRKCSKSLKKGQHHNDVIPHTSTSTPTSPNSSAGSSPFDDGTMSQSSISSSVSSNVSSTSNRRVKARCCKTCATFTPTMKAPSRCELCRSTAAVFRKKLKCQVCQKFACKACGEHQDGVPFGIQSEAKVWICNVCVGTFEKQREILLQHCHLCKEKFAEFKRRCKCKSCGATTCVQCSVSVEATTPGQTLKLSVRECRQCVEASKAKAPRSEDDATSRTSSLHLISAFEFSKDDRDRSSFGSLMRTVERSCAGVLIAVGVTVVIVVALLVYFYVVSMVIDDSWVAAWYRHNQEDL